MSRRRFTYNLMVGLVFVSMFLLAAAPMFAVELPEKLILLIEMAIMFAVTGFLKWLGGVVNKDLSDWNAIIAGAVVSAAVALINALLSTIPIAWEQAATLILELIVVLLGGMGLYGFKKQITRSLSK